jgi:hypothetical protein
MIKHTKTLDKCKHWTSAIFMSSRQAAMKAWSGVTMLLLANPVVQGTYASAVVSSNNLLQTIHQLHLCSSTCCCSIFPTCEPWMPAANDTPTALVQFNLLLLQL